MKKMKLTMLFGIVLLVFSCSTEETNNTIEDVILKEQNTTFVEQSAAKGNTVTMIIEWENNVPKSQKQIIRDDYQGGVISWSVCYDPNNVFERELWTVNVLPCDNCNPSVPDPKDRPDIRTSVPGGTCDTNPFD